MLLRQRIVLVLCSFIVYGFVIMLEGSAYGPITTIQQDNEGTMEISLRIDKPDAVPGEKVTLKELIPTEMDAQVVSILHDILHIGRYDRKSGKMMNLKYSLFGKVNADNEFDKLPGCIRCSHAYIFDVKNIKQKGAQFSFHPKHLGIYLITTTWHIGNQKRYISSNPVILTVKPLIDAKGKSVVKPEWLSDGDR